jgi:hypothetical protein
VHRIASTGGQSSFLYGSPLHAGNAIGHANHHHWLTQAQPPSHLADTVFQHPLGDKVIGNDAIAQRPYHFNCFGGTAVHFLGRTPHLHNRRFVLILPDCHNRRLLKNHPATLIVNQNIHRA